MAELVVNDSLVYYSDKGDGPVLLCVHGWMHDSSTYKNLSEELSKQFRIIAVDLPNFGKSSADERILGIKDYSEFLASFSTLR